jgi:hypothetical protein
MSDLDSLFDAMDTAKGGGGAGTYFTEGVFTVALKEIEWIPNGYKGKTCKFHFTVLTSSDPAHAVGATRTWFAKLDKSREANEKTMADIKNLVFSLLGQSPKEVGAPDKNPQAHQQAAKIFKAAIDASFAAESKISPTMLIGKQCALEAVGIKKKDGGDFTRHVWAPLPRAA